MFMEKFHSLINWLLPSMCILCANPAQNNDYFCEGCYKDLPILPHKCEQCARFLRHEGLKCGDCLNHPPAFSQTHALFPYQFPVNQLITRLKFQHKLIYAKAFGEAMAERVKNSWYVDKTLPDLIIPIPLHEQRLRERGFNQALEIARPLAQRLKIELDYQGVKRDKSTLQQSSLARKMREGNTRHAFSASRDYQGLTIALLDDVVTTGFTVRECAKVLREHGAQKVEVWCCARNG